MLKILRNKKMAKKVWIVLAVIIIPAFAFWGFGGAIRNRQESATGNKIFGHSVSNSEYQESLAAVKTSAIMQFGDNLPQIEKYLNLPVQAWERLILLHEAKNCKINVSDKEVIELIKNAPLFQGNSGFNNKIYEDTLHYVFRVQPRIFEEQMRQNISLNKLYRQVTDKIKLNDDQIRQEYSKVNQEISINYIASFYSDFAKEIKPSDKEVADYFAKNKPMFKEPPKENKEAYIPELTQIKDKVKEALIREAARNTAESKIKECAEKLKKEKFTEAASACGLKTGTTIFFKSSDEIKDFGNAGIFWNAAKKLKSEEKNQILFNDKGYYIIELKSIKPIDENKFAKEKSEFSQRLLAGKKNEAFARFTAGLKKKAQ